jgi:hypothetical protein
MLLNDGQKPQVVCYSDDFFMGKQQIDIMLRKNPTLPEELPGPLDTAEEEISDEMIAALSKRK